MSDCEMLTAIDRFALVLARVRRRLRCEMTIAKASRARDGVLAGLRHDRAGFRPRKPRAEWEATHGHPPVSDRRVALCEHCGHMWPSDVHPDDPRLATERFACPECRAVSAHFVEPKMFFTSGPSLAAQLALEEMGLS